MARKWKVRDRSFEDGRFKRYGEDERREVSRDSGSEMPQQVQPKPEYQKKPESRRISNNCVLGVVERLPRAESLSSDKKAAVGYVLYTDRTDPVFICFSKDWPFYWFHFKTGAISREPYDIDLGNPRMAFRNYPEPAPHPTFTSHDSMEPRNAFEPHVRSLAGGRINEMRTNSDGNVDVYKGAVDEFLLLAADVFRKANMY